MVQAPVKCKPNQAQAHIRTQIIFLTGRCYQALWSHVISLVKFTKRVDIPFSGLKMPLQVEIFRIPLYTMGIEIADADSNIQRECMVSGPDTQVQGSSRPIFERHSRRGRIKTQYIVFSG